MGWLCEATVIVQTPIANGHFPQTRAEVQATNINHKGLQRTANEYAEERRIYKDLISKNNNVDILNSASRILQYWSYYVKINSARHQHDTERTQNRAWSLGLVSMAQLSVVVAPYWRAPKRAKQLSMATIPLCFEFFRCRVDVLQYDQHCSILASVHTNTAWTVSR